MLKQHSFSQNITILFIVLLNTQLSFSQFDIPEKPTIETSVYDYAGILSQGRASYLEQKLQKCFNLSAEYVGIEPPEVKISRDFDIERLIGQDITALTSLFDQQVIDREEFRDILVQGEVLPTANEAKPE